MADDNVRLDFMDAAERVLALNKLSKGFRERFYVHITSARRVLLIESKPPLRVLESTDPNATKSQLNAKEAPWVIVTDSRNLFALWEPSKKFDVAFVNTKAYMDIQKQAYSHTRPEVELAAQKMALEIAGEIEEALQTDEFLIKDFSLYKEEIESGESDPNEEMRRAAIDTVAIFKNRKGIADMAKDHQLKLEKAYCARIARRYAEQDLTRLFFNVLDARARLRCVIGFAQYKRMNQLIENK